MAAVINKRDAALQAASPRTITVNLGATVNVNGSVSGNVTGTLNGTAVSTVVNAALSATANYFTTGTVDPTGGNNGDAYYNSTTNVMWFKISGVWQKGGTINANQITTGTLAAARIAANSITVDKLSVSSLSAISANLGSVNAGTITGTANINITGVGQFGGNQTLNSYNAAIHANPSGAAINGIYCRDGGSSGAALVASGITSGADGINAQAVGSSGRAIYGLGVSGAVAIRAEVATGTALEVVGNMTITSSALVSNLRAQTCLLADNSTKWAGFSTLGTSTGTATATQSLTNKPGSNSSNTWLKISNGANTFVWPVWPL